MGNVPWSSSISLNPYNPDFVTQGNLALFALAAFFDHARPGPNPYYPEMAKSWTLGPHSITFNLQPNATWQDGTPFTSKDVVTSLLVAGGVGSTRCGPTSLLSRPPTRTPLSSTCSPGRSHKTYCSSCSSFTRCLTASTGTCSRVVSSRTS